VNNLYDVTIISGLHYNCTVNKNLVLKLNDKVVIRCGQYQDYGVVSRCFEQENIDEQQLQKQVLNIKGRKVDGQNTPQILRIINSADQKKIASNQKRDAEMFSIVQAKIQEHKLDMKLINAHLTLDQKLSIFQFSADGRVDFRSLLRDLSQSLNTRVELRQVGVRDEAAIQGGLGACGRPFCCSTFLKKFVSINVKMAKVQGLSLNPHNISGSCGRLKCCLHYEYNCYRKRQQTSASNCEDCVGCTPLETKNANVKQKNRHDNNEKNKKQKATK